MSQSRAVPGVPDATCREVEAGELPAGLPNGIDLGPGIEAARGRLLFEIPDIARYLVSDGRTIAFETRPGADPDAVELFLHGSARGVLIQQRGEIPLDAATVKSPAGQCIALAGRSGEGKSTLAAALCLRGWSLVADEITRITFMGKTPIAWPSHRALKLWRNACESFGTDTGGLKRVRAGLEKYFVEVRACDQPCLLTAVVQLRAVARSGLAKIVSAERATILSDCGFRPHLIEPLGCRESYHSAIADLAAACPVFVLLGARHAAVDELADAINRLAL